MLTIFKMLMASELSSQQTTHALFLLLPLNLPLLFIPNVFVVKCNDMCDYLKKGENLKGHVTRQSSLSFARHMLMQS